MYTCAKSNSQQKYYFVVNLVKQNPVEQLVQKLREGKSISRDQVIRDSKFPLLRFKPQTHQTENISAKQGFGW